MRADVTTADAALEIPHRELLELSARFCHAFSRWLDASSSGGLTYPRLRRLQGAARSASH